MSAALISWTEFKSREAFSEMLDYIIGQSLYLSLPLGYLHCEVAQLRVELAAELARWADDRGKV